VEPNIQTPLPDIIIICGCRQPLSQTDVLPNTLNLQCSTKDKYATNFNAVINKWMHSLNIQPILWLIFLTEPNTKISHHKQFELHQIIDHYL